ncbi:hypothetical protein MMC13_004845 [Lambiella insularis]|nr:hypothetical protein [Lambiella insularis]
MKRYQPQYSLSFGICLDQHYQPNDLRIACLGEVSFAYTSSDLSGTFLGFNGTLTTSCSAASTYTLSNGQLYENVNGATLQFSASGTVGYAYFIPTLVPFSITATFSLGEEGTLLWINPSFFNGNALFCVQADGSIVAVFQQGAQPSSCDFIDITIEDLTACVSQLGPSGACGLSGMPGPSGPPGTIGPSGASGLSDHLVRRGQQECEDSGLSGLPGAFGVPGMTGPSGPPGPSGPSGPTGASGMSGLPGASGLSGLLGASGASGLSGKVGPSGPPGTTNASGLSGAVGAVGPPGPTGVSGIAYAYLGCFYQTGTTTSTTGKALSTFEAVYTGNANAQCSSTSLAGGYTFGIVNNGTSAGDCYCGNTLIYVMVSLVAQGQAADNNCYLCNYGYGECRNYTANTIGVYGSF